MDAERVEITTQEPEMHPAEAVQQSSFTHPIAQHLHEILSSLEDASSRLTTAEVAMLLAILSQSDANSPKFRHADSQLNRQNFPIDSAVSLPGLLHHPGIEESVFNKYASNPLIAAIKATVDVPGHGLASRRENTLAVVNAALLLSANRNRHATMNPVGRQVFSVAQDVCGRDGEKVVNKPPEFVQTKEQLFARAKKWILQLPAEHGGYLVSYGFSTAAFDVVSQIGIVSENVANLRFSPKAEQILLALIFGLNSRSIVNGRMVKEQIADDVKAQVLKVYRRIHREDSRQLAGYTPELGMPFSQMKKVNAGIKLDCPIAAELLIAEIDRTPRSAENYEDQYAALMHSLRGEPDYHPLLRALLQVVIERHVGALSPAQCSHPYAQALTGEGVLLNTTLNKAYFQGEWHVLDARQARIPSPLYIHYLSRMLTDRVKKFANNEVHV